MHSLSQFSDDKKSFYYYRTSDSCTMVQSVPERIQLFAGIDICRIVENCDNECILTLVNGLNLREYENIFLNFWFYPSTRIDSNDSEGIVIEASDGGTTWDQLAYWNDDNATGSAWNMAS